MVTLGHLEGFIVKAFQNLTYSACIVVMGVSCLTNCQPAGEHRDGSSQQGLTPVAAFEAAMIVSSNPQALIRDWKTAPEQVPKIEVTSRVRRGRDVVVVVAFRNCLENEDGECDVRAEMSVWKPDGNKYGGSEDVELWKGRGGSVGAYQLGTNQLTFRAEQSDPLGVYVLRAVVRDNHGGKSVKLEQVLRVMSE